MVTFYANPDDQNEPWIERAGITGYGFRIWHYIFFLFSAFVVIVILTCCCFKFRIPRTKQEIESDYRRKKLTEKFRARLKLIQNQDMDVVDLQKALEIILEDYKKETKGYGYENLPENITASAENPGTLQPLSRKLSKIIQLTRRSQKK